RRVPGAHRDARNPRRPHDPEPSRTGATKLRATANPYPRAGLARSVTYRLVYESGAEQLASRLAPDVKPLVKRAIERLRNNPHLGKELRFELAGYRSLRSRRYRVIYRVRDSERVVEVHYFGQRREVYETFRDMLSKR